MTEIHTRLTGGPDEGRSLSVAARVQKSPDEAFDRILLTTSPDAVARWLAGDAADAIEGMKEVWNVL